MTHQMQVGHIKQTIDEVRKETYIVKQAWVLKQNKNVYLLDQRNKQFNELNKVRKCKYLIIGNSSLYYLYNE